MNYIAAVTEPKTFEARAFRRRYLHLLYRETLRDYHTPTTDWMRRATRHVLLNIWENYRNA